jgi:hypothetical protein
LVIPGFSGLLGLLGWRGNGTSRSPVARAALVADG